MQILGRNGFTIAEIAAHVGSTFHAVRHVLWQHKIGTRNKHNRRRNYQLRSLAIVMLRNGSSCRDVAKKADASVTQVLDVVRQMVREGLVLQERWPGGRTRYVVGHDALFRTEVKEMSLDDCKAFVLAGGEYDTVKQYLAPQRRLEFGQWYAKQNKKPLTVSG